MVKLLELFGGIGACTKAFKRLGIEFEVVDYVEIDRFAVASYNAINGTDFEPQDITKWNKDIEVDFIMHGSPCQDFSLSGGGKGGDKGSGTRSSLMWETIRIVEQLKPKYVVWENVRNLIAGKHKHNFDLYINQMNEIGYVSYWQVLNAKDYGIPQNRQRVFTISIRKDINQHFEFPDPQVLRLRLKDMLEPQVDEKYYLSDLMKKYVLSSGTGTFYAKPQIDLEIARPITSTTYKIHRAGSDNFVSSLLIRNATSTGYDIGFSGDFVNLAYPDSRTRRGRVGHQVAQTLQCSDAGGVITEDSRIRRLTPKECWRLMGFDDSDYEKASQVNSDTQLYKQAGNSIVVNVLEAILKQLFTEQKLTQYTIYDFIGG